MSRFQELVEERDQIRREIEVLQARLRDLRVRQAALECALEFAVPDAKVIPLKSSDSGSYRKAA
ncbi:MAG: hypothetical protein QM758_09240 [Armatimonas sp.]